MNLLKKLILDRIFKFEETPWNILRPPLLLQTAYGVFGITKGQSTDFGTGIVLFIYSSIFFCLYSYVAFDTITVQYTGKMAKFTLIVLLYRLSIYFGYVAIGFKNISRSNASHFRSISNDVFSTYKKLHLFKNMRLRKYFIFSSFFTFWSFCNMIGSFIRSQLLFGARNKFFWNVQGFMSTSLIECDMVVCSTLLMILADCLEKASITLNPETELPTVLIDKESIEYLRSHPTTVENIGSCNDLVNINKASKTFSRIFEIVERLRDYFQLQIFLHLSGIFWGVLLSLGLEVYTAAYRRGPYDWSVYHTIVLAIMFLRMFLVVFLLCACCQRLKNKLNDLKVALVCVAVRTKDRETQRRARAVIRSISLQKTDVVVYGLFQVDNGFIVRYIGLMSTYMVVVLQFFL